MISENLTEESERLQKWLRMRSSVGKVIILTTRFCKVVTGFIGWVSETPNLNTINKKGANKGIIKHNKYININVVP